MERGVYTVTCDDCGQFTYVHIDAKGGFDPNRCRSCKIRFQDIVKGERNNQYIGIVKEEDKEENRKLAEKDEDKKSSKNFFGNKQEEDKKSEKKSFEKKEEKKSSKKSFETQEEDKKDAKKLFKW